jgi:hypothetical protein
VEHGREIEPIEASFALRRKGKRFGQRWISHLDWTNLQGEHQTEIASLTPAHPHSQEFILESLYFEYFKNRMVKFSIRALRSLASA